MTAPEPTRHGKRDTYRLRRRLGRSRPAHTTIAVLLALAMTVAACGSGSSQEERMPEHSPSETATDTIASEALTFGGIVLPPSAKVLAADADKGIDQLYTLALEVDPPSVEALLSRSRFTTPLTPGRKVFMEPAPGYEPNNSTDIASAQDRLLPEGERIHTVTREILIDRSNPVKSIVHLWLFTT